MQKDIFPLQPVSRGLDNIPAYPVTLKNENADIITQLSQVENFLYLIDPGTFASKADFIQAVKNTNFDLLICDPYFNQSLLTPNDLFDLKHKANGGQRLILAYMSIGEAEDYRYYWDASWDKKRHARIGCLQKIRIGPEIIKSNTGAPNGRISFSVTTALIPK